MVEYELSELEQEVVNFVAIKLWKIISSNEEPVIKLERIIDAISDFFKIEKCSLMLKDKSGNFRVAVSKGLSNDIQETILVSEGQGIAGLAIKEKKAIFVKKVGVSFSDDERSYKTDNFISYPITIKGEVIGILNLTDRMDERSFRSRDLVAITPIIERIKFVLKDMRF